MSKQHTSSAGFMQRGGDEASSRHAMGDRPGMPNLPRKPVQTVSSSSLRHDGAALPLGLEPYVDASDAGRFLGMHPKTLMRLARGHIVPAYSFNDGTRHRWRFLKSELDIWMQSRVNSNSHPVRFVS